MPNPIRPFDEALTLVPDGARLGVGGVLLRRKPIAFLDALATAGRRDLRVHSFLASLDAELLAVRGALAEMHSGYVGFEQLGRAIGYEAAVRAGRLTAHEYSELLFVTGLRAAGAGLPFLPTRGATGSDLLAELGLRGVTCPYTGEEVVAVPAMRLDVAVVHASAAGADGTVLGPAEADFLHDADAVLARAADVVIVTVERILDDERAHAARHRALLFGHEVDAVVVAPGGARPTALPGEYPADLAGLRRYLADPGGGLDPLLAAASAAAAAGTGARR
ncbi:CoA transferase subunit A [Pseudonocardia parietis]|uniref:Glutaconate CoA-transferase subunit A n=1 Tax=Pseudonocardia parietis TaxID=570936 RepID=A0ABS4VV45_9PSEU|nr:CoA-transferase [Pseudonocardia parietis]MBP2367787.1 glutaconate CoA-transferase subunit A [Pseudonocardia parietis]